MTIRSPLVTSPRESSSSSTRLTIASVSCIGSTHIPERVDEKGKTYQATADDSAYATFMLDGGLIAHINMSWCTRVYRDDLVTFHVDGTHGSAVAGLTDPVRQREYAHLLAELAGVAESSVLIALDRAVQGAPAPAAEPSKRGSVQERLEREMLRLLARDREVWDAFAGRLTVEHFRSPAQRALFQRLVEAGGEVSAIVSRADEGDPIVAKVTALTVEPLEGPPTRSYAEGVWAGLQHQLLKRQSDELRLELQKRNPTTDPEYDALFERLVTLDAQLRRLRAGHEPAASTGA